MGAKVSIEPSANRERAVGIVREPWVGSAAVDDRGLVEVVGFVDHPGAVRVAEGRRVRDPPLRDGVEVYIGAADVGVEVDELGRCDRALPQRCEPVLDADVVERKAGKAVTDLLLGRGPYAR